MKKEYRAISRMDNKTRSKGMVFISIIMVLCIVALMLCIYSFSTDNIVFGVSYIIGIILGLSYIVIKLNQLYSTFIAADDKNLILKCWDNRFFPYNAWNGIPVIREFIPSRTQLITVPMDEITDILIGTKSYIKRNADDESFNKDVLPYEKRKYSNITGLLDKANILYIRTDSGESVFMSIEGFNSKEAMNVINRFARFCDDSVVIKINARAYRRYLTRPESAPKAEPDESE